MSKHKYRPNYEILYPGVEIPPDVLDFLKKSDMRMEYEDYHRKRERVVKDSDGNINVLPSLEDSLDRLLEAYKQFPADMPSPEEIFLDSAEIETLHHCVALLDKDEQRLIEALFNNGMTVREYAAASGLSKSKVDRDKKKILDKLKNLLINFKF